MGMKEAPRLNRSGRSSWWVFLPGNIVAYGGETPGEAMAKAAQSEDLDPQWCRTCAGIGASLSWSGEPPLAPCEACNGTRAARG